MKCMWPYSMALLVCLLGTMRCGNDGGQNDQVCMPEDKKCNGNDVVKCNSSGTEWVFYKECDESCSQGECMVDAQSDAIPDGLPGTSLDVFVDAGEDTTPYRIVDVVPEVSFDTATEIGADGVGVDACQPSCEEKECGGDGCGGSCGDCASPQDICKQGLCVCQLDCAGKECGDDGCGGSCGVCNCGEECTNSQCLFVGCDGKECGGDGCGGTCGDCGVGENCQDGQCVGGSSGDTWTDPTSGRTWQVVPTGGNMNWSDAKSHCAGLSLDGGGWHLPSISELRTLIRGCPGTVTDGACKVTDFCLSYLSCWEFGACHTCSWEDAPAGGCFWPDEMQGFCSWYWSSSPAEDVDDYGWIVGFHLGHVKKYLVNYGSMPVRCVR